MGTAALLAPAASAETSAGIQVIPLPVNQTFGGPGPAFKLIHTGSGQSAQAGFFMVNNSASASNALLANTNGTVAALRGVTTGAGPAASFQVNNQNNRDYAVRVTTNSTYSFGGGLSVINAGEGSAAYLESNADNVQVNTLEARNFGTGAAAVFSSRSGVLNPRAALEVESDASGGAASFHWTGGSDDFAIDADAITSIGGAGRFTVTNSVNDRTAIEVAMNGGPGSWAGTFTSTGPSGGVRISTGGGPGLQVLGGSKNAVVGTSTGARALYTEESSEVWFTDYGFARLTKGRAHVSIDATFGETVRLDVPYHVFVQTYGDADLVVRNRTAQGFDVEKRGGREKDAEFSYRLVAKRRGFERERMMRAPWADSITAVLSRSPRR